MESILGKALSAFDRAVAGSSGICFWFIPLALSFLVPCRTTTLIPVVDRFARFYCLLPNALPVDTST